MCWVCQLVGYWNSPGRGGRVLDEGDSVELERRQ